MVLYSVADHASLEIATEILAAIVNNNDRQRRPPVTLLGNKLDLADFRQVMLLLVTLSKTECVFLSFGKQASVKKRLRKHV